MQGNEDGWYPVAASTDLPFRHIFQTELLGHELVVWRADDGFVNIWPNRCLHRGSRLSVGVNDGAELVCAYHGWRYANLTAGCTYIPAHPSDSPPRTVCNQVYPSTEIDGLVWTSLGPSGRLLAPEGLGGETPLTLRSLPINATIEIVASQLGTYGFEAPIGAVSNLSQLGLVSHAENHLLFCSGQGTAAVSAHFILQPSRTGQTVIHGLVTPAPKESLRLSTLRHYNRQLTRFREEVESGVFAEDQTKPEAHQPPLESALLGSGGSAQGAVDEEFEVLVAKKWMTAAGIAGFELRAVAGGLPTFQPGAHIDLHLPNGLVRQYSLVNGPGIQDRYLIGVKLEEGSRGGSQCLHEEVNEGNTLRISGPYNNFPLRRDAPRTVLLAGGIGVTPLLSMAQALIRSKVNFALHYFVQSEDHLAFSELVDRLGTRAFIHTGLSPAETLDLVKGLLGTYDSLSQVYVCGPPAMIGEVRNAASGLGWPVETIHYEYFKNETVVDDDSTFEIDLARSDMTLVVDAGKTILQVLRENGVVLSSSCEQGACGTCEVAVLEGLPRHQDVYLNESEHAAGDRIMTCVSRSRSDRLVLDI